MSTLARCVCVCWLLLSVVTHAAGVTSGLGVGAPTPSIPVWDVTGAYKGQRICYVCEFQDAPNVLAFFRDTGEDTARLIEQLNALYVQHKASGFKAVVMIAAGKEASPWLEQLHAGGAIEIPLTVFTRGPRDVAARLYELNPEADNTFLVTVNRFVAVNIADIAPEEFDRVASAAADVVAKTR